MPKWLDSLRSLIGEDCLVTNPEELRRHAADRWPVAIKWEQAGLLAGPGAIALPRNTRQVADIVKWAGENQVAITPRGLGSSVTGSSMPEPGGLCLDLSRMNATLRINPEDLYVTTEAGKQGLALENELNAQGLSLMNIPQSVALSSVGGWVATRATGHFSSRYGGMEDLVIGLEAVTPDGNIIQTPLSPRACLGPNLNHLFIGAEGVFGIVTAVTLKVFPLPETKIPMALSFGDIGGGIASMRDIMREGLRPALVRFYDEDESRHLLRDPAWKGNVFLLACEGATEVARAEFDKAMEICARHGGKPIGTIPVETWLHRRFDFSAIEKILNQPAGVAETIEICHFWSGISTTYRELKAALKPHCKEVLGHFSHVYPQGTSLYMILLHSNEKASGPEEASRRLLKLWEVTMAVCQQTGACVAHHHGVGLARLPVLNGALGPAHETLRQIKRALDPTSTLCPGKLGLVNPPAATYSELLKDYSNNNKAN